MGTNRDEFVDTIQGSMFPYRLCRDYAEFYGYVPIKAKIGFKVELDSDKGVMKIYDNSKMVDETSVAVTMEEANIKFVRKNSKFDLMKSE